MTSVAATSTTKTFLVRSLIQFPYRDLAAAISVAQRIHERGAVPHATDQLAAALGLQQGSGNFVVRVAAARMFGLIAFGGGQYSLTDLGFEITDKKDEKRRQRAMIEAFLAVPLYRKVYDEFRGKQLPPRNAGLEAAFVRFGVSPKQATAARQIFDRSATLAGFFGDGEDRLVEPVIAGSAAAERRPLSGDEANDSDTRPTASPPVQQPSAAPLHPFVQGLLQSLPHDSGAGWPLDERVEWLKAAVHSFNLMFKNVGEITIAGTPKTKPATPPVAAPVTPPSLRQAMQSAPADRPAAKSKAELDDDIPF